MIRERKFFLGCLIGVGLVTMWTGVVLFRSWNVGMPPLLLAAQSLSVVAGWLTVFMAWRAFQGVRPAPRDSTWIALDIITPAVLLLILVTLWVERRR